MAQKLPKIAQKLALAKKNSRDISPVSPTFSISVPDSRPSQAPPFHEGGHQGDQASSSLSPERTSLAEVTSLVFCPQWHSSDLSGYPRMPDCSRH